jgi:hypothetical protein
MGRPKPSLPPVLGPVVAHAERFAQILEGRERHVSTRDMAALWLVGRAGELRCLLAVLLEDHEQGRVRAGQAAVELARHLNALHAGFAAINGRQAPLCCVESVEPTTSVLLRDLASAPRGGRR